MASEVVSVEYMRGFDEGRLAAAQEIESLRAALDRVAAHNAKWRQEARVRLGWTPYGLDGLRSPKGWVPFECDKRD